MKNASIDVPAAVVCLVFCMPLISVCAWLGWRAVDLFEASVNSKILIWALRMIGLQATAMLSFEAICEAVSELAGKACG